MTVNQARSFHEALLPADVKAIERYRQAVELVADIERPDVAVSDSRTRISAAVAASGTSRRRYLVRSTIPP